MGAKKVIALDGHQGRLDQLRAEIGANSRVSFVHADITNKPQLEAVFKVHPITVVFHAAAQKFLPELEVQPQLAHRVNVLGTEHVADCVIAYAVHYFLNISTDKAVQPISVLGTSKQEAERYLKRVSLEHPQRHMNTVRLGNILNSRGSVLPLFEQQLQAEGKIEVRHAEATRYMIRLDRAIGLLLQIPCLKTHGHCYILEMGNPLSVLKLAQWFLQCKGLVPETYITYTQLLPGEKLEEILCDAASHLLSTTIKGLYEVG